MQQDNTVAPGEAGSEALESDQEQTLRWLIEQDYEEQTEKLFTLSQQEDGEITLSAQELELASRPMFSGDRNLDDLSTVAAEEIVVDDISYGSDIFDIDLEIDEAMKEPVAGPITVDHAAPWHDLRAEPEVSVADGADILELNDDDDMGEHFLVIRKGLGAESAQNEQPQPLSATEIAQPEATVPETAAGPAQSLPENAVEAPADTFDDTILEAPPRFEDLTELAAEQADDTGNDSAPETPPGFGNLAELALELPEGTGNDSAPEAPTRSDRQVERSAEVGEVETGRARQGSDVLDYIAAWTPPRDDDEFDRYLLQGSHLGDLDADIDDLVLEAAEGAVAVDPEPAGAIDYHEDFGSACAGASGDSAFALALASAMARLSAAVEQRLAQLALSADSIDVQMTLGSEGEASQRFIDEGYMPLAQMGLPGLDVQSTGAEQIYVRLLHTESGACWNDLLRDEFRVPGDLGAELETAVIDAEFAEPDQDFERLLQQPAPCAEADLGFDDLVADSSEDELLDILGDLPQPTGESAPEPAFSEADLDPLGDFGSLDDLGDCAGDATPTDVDAMLDSFADDGLDGEAMFGIEVGAFGTGSGAGTDPVAATVSVPQELRWCVPEGIPFNDSAASGGEVFADFLDAFIEEAESELEKLEDAVGAWEADVESERAYAPVPRILHTLKGIAKGVGLQRYGTLMHNFETLLDGLARPGSGSESGYFHIINAWLDASVRGFHHVRDRREDVASVFPQASSAPLDLESAQPQDNASAPLSEPVSLPEVSVEEINQRLGTPRQSEAQIAEEGAKALAAQQSIRMAPEAIDHLLHLTNQTQQLGVRASQATVQSKGATAELQGRLSSVRAHIAKIADRALANVTAMGKRLGSDMDALEMDQYSELQEAANILREGVEDLDDLINLSSRQSAQIELLLKQQASVVSLLGSAIQSARVVPVSRLMPGLRRIVRTVSSDLGKAVQFRVLNEVGSLDRDNHARCQIVLEHMVRNALDHAIETPAERIAAGKPAAGQITVDVSKQGGDYIIELRDDGRGIDPDLMRETAYDKGLDVDIDALSDAEAQRLIFHKGFSTAESVSEISGRGVGMDIVLSELQHIGGDIDIQSEVGAGTTFRVRIPSNMTFNGALLVNAGQVSYAIPLDGLVAVEHVERDTFYEAVENGRRLQLFGLECEPSYLATLCHNEGLPERGAWSNTTVPVIIAGGGERHMAIAVDDVKQALELVIRSLGSQFSALPGVTGAATTADGQAIVALDLNALVASVSPEEQFALPMETQSSEHVLVLVVDDSRTQRLVATKGFDSIGVETVTAENGQVALDFLNSTHRLPDVVLLDVEMPVKDGIQTLRDIRKTPRLEDLPVIMVTSRTGAKHRSLAQEAGCNGYMGKPFNFPVLVEMIAEQTGRDLQLL